MSTFTSPPLFVGNEDSVLSANLRSLFTCPMCMEYMSSPILQCLNGHLVCVSCHAKQLYCHSCNCHVAIRNFAMEKVAENIKFPCKHSSYGCNGWLSYAEKAYHEDTCMFRPRYPVYFDGAYNYIMCVPTFMQFN